MSESQPITNEEAVVSNMTESAVSNESTQPNMSKRQQKRLARRQKDMLNRVEKRKKERERRKLRGKVNLCNLEDADGNIVQVHRKKLKSNLMSLSSNKLRLVVDCSFEHLMSDSDIHHLGKQLGYCYGTNRRMTSPLQFYMTSCANKTSELLGRSGLTNWDVHLKEKHFLDVFANEPKENLCYLTSDSPNELNEFDESKVYIIGGLVDHNHHKSLCYDLAVKNGLMHYHLPISKYMNMKTRSVLTVNQVFQIICKYVECKDWKRAFIDILPKRKGAEIKEEDDEKDQNENKSDDQTKPEEEHQQGEHEENQDSTSTSTSTSSAKEKVDSTLPDESSKKQTSQQENPESRSL